MTARAEQMYELVWRTRRLFQQLRASGDELLQGTGINASQRAVLEFLNLKQSQTVSNMAREKNVSRQHIQTVVNDLLALGFVEAKENPAHKRSPLILLTTDGKKLFRKITQKESRLLEVLAKEFNEKNVATTIDTLMALENCLASAK